MQDIEFEITSERISSVEPTFHYASQKMKKENLITSAGISNNHTSFLVDLERQVNEGNNTIRGNNTKNLISASSMDMRETNYGENSEKGSEELPEVFFSFFYFYIP